MTIDLIEVVSNGCLNVRFISEEGSYLRECISPSQPERISELNDSQLTELANLTWTPEVINNWLADKE